MRDERDDPKVVTDVNGDSFYVTEDGQRIQIKDPSAGDAMKELEEKLKRPLWDQCY